MPLSAFAEQEPMPVAIHTATIDTLTDTLSYPAVVHADIENKIFAEFSGIIDTLNVELGQQVGANDVLMRLQRTQPGYAPIDIKSKIAGSVVDLPFNQGAQVNAGEVLAHIADIRALSLSINVPTKERHYFKVSTQGTMVFSHLDKTFNAHVKGIAPKANHNTGTFLVRLSIDDVVDGIYPGLLGKVSFAINPREGIALPMGAVFHEKGKPVVRLVKENTVVKQLVKLGNTLPDGRVEVLEGIAAGDNIIIEPGKYLKAGQSVKAKE